MACLDSMLQLVLKMQPRYGIQIKPQNLSGYPYMVINSQGHPETFGDWGKFDLESLVFSPSVNIVRYGGIFL